MSSEGLTEAGSSTFKMARPHGCRWETSVSHRVAARSPRVSYLEAAVSSVTKPQKSIVSSVLLETRLGPFPFREHEHQGRVSLGSSGDQPAHCPVILLPSVRWKFMSRCCHVLFL